MSAAKGAGKNADHGGPGPGPRLRVVQRLDKETSGLLVFARTVAAERHLQQQLRAHSMLRRYLALVHGSAADATYDTLLVADRGDGLRGSWGVFRRPKGTPPETARRAVTHVEVLEPLRGATFVACELETGRQHQIRIHLSEAGFPLVGERVYVRGFAGPLLPAPRPMLHAARLGFVHPRTGRELLFEAPPPPDFTAALDRLRR
jgi:23S rRNA pseudouridine1911/1915/1917 synthase